MLTYVPQGKSVIDREMIDAARRSLDKTWISFDKRYGEGDCRDPVSITPKPKPAQCRPCRHNYNQAGICVLGCGIPAPALPVQEPNRECIVCGGPLNGTHGNSKKCDLCQVASAAAAQSRYRKTAGAKAGRKRRENKS